LISVLHPNRYERAIRDLNTGSGTFRSVLAGSARAARLSSVRDSRHEQIIWDTASDVLGPLVFLFVWWVLEEASAKGIERLYFFARDGHLMMKVADILKKERGYDVKCTYLHGSRGAWFPIAVTGIEDFEWEWMTSGFLESISISELCKRLRVDKTLLEGQLPAYGLGGTDSEAKLSVQELRHLKACLSDERTQKLIIDNNLHEFENAIAYFRQEGLCDGERIGIVDTGWGARCQYALSSILDRSGNYPSEGIEGFYMGLSEAKWVYKKDELHHLMFDWNTERIDPDLSNYLFFELLMSTDHGRTTGYRFTDSGLVEPVLDETGVKEAIAWGIRLQHEGAVRFTELAARFLADEKFDRKTAKTALRKIVKMLIANPSRDEANEYGEYIIGAEMAERDLQKFAPRFRGGREFWATVSGRRRFKGFWPAGSFVRSDMVMLKLAWDILLKIGLFTFIKRFLLKCS